MLEGKNVTLRPIDRKDTDKIIYWRNQSFVRERFIYQEPFTKESHEKWLKQMVNTGRVQQFIICSKCSENEQRKILPIGSIYLKDIDLRNGKAEFGIFIGEKKSLGKGYGTEAAKILLNYAFQDLKLHKVMLRVFASNKRALKCYKKVGFEEEGYFKDEVKIQNKYQDIVYMAAFE